MTFLLALKKDLEEKIKEDNKEKTRGEEETKKRLESYEFYERERQKLFREAEERRRLELKEEELRQQKIKEYEAKLETPPEGSVLLNCRFRCNLSRQEMGRNYVFNCDIDYTIENKPRKWLTTFSSSVTFTVTEECLRKTVLEHISKETYDTSRCEIYRR
jgi:hypothetical protein